MSINKLIEDVKVMKFEKDDILIVKLKEKRIHKEVDMIRRGLQQVIPKGLNIRIIFSNPDIDFEILRKG
jgi:hypothetical protein